MVIQVIPKYVQAIETIVQECVRPLDCSSELKTTLRLRVFNKVLSRWQKLWNRRRRKNLRRKWELLWGCGGMLPGKILKSGPVRVHFQHSGAKLECLNRTQTSLNFSFLGGNFQRKVGSEFT